MGILGGAWMRKAYNKGIYFGRRVSLFFLFGLFSFPLLGSVVSLSLCVLSVWLLR